MVEKCSLLDCFKHSRLFNADYGMPAAIIKINDLIMSLDNNIKVGEDISDDDNKHLLYYQLYLEEALFMVKHLHAVAEGSKPTTQNSGTYM